jgi:hypothetical protein
MSIESLIRKHREALRKKQKNILLSMEEADILLNELISLMKKVHEKNFDNPDNRESEVISIDFDSGFFPSSEKKK